MAADGTTLVDTLQSIDALIGGAGTDTLNVTLNGAGATPTLNGIEIVNLRATGVTELNLSAATGVTDVKVANSTAVATLTSVGTAAVGVANQNQDVNINGSTATALTLNLDTVGTAATDITVDLGSATANAATSFAITAKDAHVTFAETTAGAATTSASVAATGSNEITFAAADLASLTSMSVTGAGSVDFTGGKMTALKTLTAGDGGVKVDATSGVLETATTGAGKDTITAVGANVKNISTGAGDDTVKTVTSALAAKSVVNLGAGNDTLSMDTEPTAGVTLTGGDGTDTLAVSYNIYDGITATNPFTAAQLALITGFETLSITDVLADASNVDLSKISGLVSFQTAGVGTLSTATVSNVGNNASVIMKGTLDINDGALTVSMKDATGSSDVLNLILNDNYTEGNDATSTVTLVTETVSASGVETLNVSSTGTPSTAFLGATGTKADGVENTLALTDSALVTLNVSGDQAFSFTSTTDMTKLATVNASALDTLHGTGATIDVSAAKTDGTAAAITITGSADMDTIIGSGNADTISAGAGNDIINGGAKADVLTGGVGNDIFVMNNAEGVGTDSTLAAMDVITDFSANIYGNGTDGAAGTGAAADATKWTGDVLKFDVLDTITKVDVSVQTSSADAQVFIQNVSNSTEDTVAAALDSTTGKLYIDLDSDGAIDSVIELTGVTTITEAAFVLNGGAGADDNGGGGGSTPEKVEVSADIGTGANTATLDAAGEDFLFTDDANIENFVSISNFDDGDSIQVTNAEVGDYNFSNDGVDVDITYNNTDAGVLNEMTLVGVVDSISLVYDEASFETAIGFDAFAYV
jgi:hypothetical protein